ncbi:SPFH domain-containing protein [Rubricoccus marinus]|uniref:Antifreeze protein n=1 Tax=Rubricoccus marinus TaxID=716817 RepID=A0A259U1K4_9BACT|nr:SPFH domain-containing protein [Rubricoccus marinus]OZC03923.1 antifreeze protein [Rubricoccus marinus]
MGLMDRLRNELIDVIEWTDDSRDTIVWRFPRHGNEIKSGAMLTVREGQTAVFVDEGQLADVFTPGTYKLTTANMPILTTLESWKYGFESPFKAEVYFVNTRRFTNQKWGTKNPIMLRDPEFGPTRLRAFGTFTFRVTDADTFLTEVVGTSGDVSTPEVTDHIRNLVVSRFTEALGEAKLAALDLAANYSELGGALGGKMEESMEAYGVELKDLVVENISLPPEVEKAMDERTSMGVIGNLGAYTQFQTAKAMEAAASNPGGGAAAAGVGLGAGMAMAQGMAGSFMQPQGQQQASGATPPPPPPAAPSFHVSKDGQTAGPFTMDQLKAQAASGELTRESHVWREGMDGWKTAGEVEAMQPVFGAVPPPPPAA